MTEACNTIGFVVIVTLYTVIGLLSVVGSIVITKKIFSPISEQIFYGIFLLPIAGFYLAFTAYFEIEAAWRLELAAVTIFFVIGLIGTRIPFAIILGYPLHGIWDVLHEIHMHGGFSIFESGQVTSIPLAYGFFCLAYDFGISVYFCTRRSVWDAAWQSKRI